MRVELCTTWDKRASYYVNCAKSAGYEPFSEKGHWWVTIYRNEPVALPYAPISSGLYIFKEDNNE